ncbi:hypothetical protein AL527_06595 [Pseudomonas fulva]|uniref:TetR/AcrR family transcriptional regulator n=1 Tax=Pseudomonas fulva TaxID=47880 RepID=UPI000CE98E0F|nr:TetR/AcrR family transcriptional regulator [Pseudomonas fulva]AVF54871.1 hypothetical protein AL527_06595 [Pseudomonas fulva]
MHYLPKAYLHYLVDRNEPECESDSKSEVQQAALSLFLEFGYASVSLRQIADLANIKQGSIHKVSGGKEQVFATLFMNAATGLLEEVSAANPRNMSVPKAISSYVESYVRCGLQYRLHHMLFRREGHLLSGDVRTTLNELRDQKITRLWEVLAVGQAKQIFAVQDARFAAKAIVAMLDELINNSTVSGDKLQDSIQELQGMALRLAGAT